MKQNLRKKALFPAIAMVLAAIIALSGVTYAWFTTGTTANVQSLDVNVATANGIQVSLDASSWKSTITAADIQAAITGATSYTDRCIQYPTTEIAPVSSAGNVVDGKMEMFFGAYNQNGNLDSTREEESNGKVNNANFIAFDLFFKTSNEQMLSLNVGAGMSIVNCINLTGGDTNMGTERAVRVAFIPMGSAATDVAARDLTVASGKAIIWEPNHETRAPGVEGSGKVDYSGFTAEFKNIAENALSSAEVEPVSVITKTEALVNLENTITKVRVYIWLEGQDVDCINNISNGDFSVNLQFAVPETEKTTTAPDTGDNG